MRRRVNKSAIALLIGLGFIAALSIHLLHGYQLTRGVQRLVKQAQMALATGQYAQTKSNLEQLLSLGIYSEETCLWYIQAVRELSLTPSEKAHCLSLLKRSLHHLIKPKGRLLRELAFLAHQFGQDTVASQYAQQAQSLEPSDAEIVELLMQCAERQGQYAEAVRHGEVLTQLRPDDLTCFNRVAMIYAYHLQQPTQAAAILNAMVQANLANAQAYILRARYCMRRGLVDAALADLAFARDQLLTKSLDLYLALADAYRQQARLDESRCILQEAMSAFGPSLALFHALARLELQAGQVVLAGRHVRAALPLINTSEERWATIELLLDLGDASTARELLAACTPLQADHHWPQYLNARIDLIAGHYGQARTQFEYLLNRLPAGSDLAIQSGLNLAYCYSQQGNLDGQRTTYERILRMDSRCVQAQLGLARTLSELGRYDEALGLYLNIAQSTPTVRLLAARLLIQRVVWNPERLADLTEALRLLDDTPEPLGQSLDAALLRVQAHALRGQLNQAQQTLHRIITAHPKAIEPHLILAALTARQGDWKLALKMVADLQGKLGDSVDLRLMRAALIQSQSPRERLIELIELAQGYDQFPRDEQIRLLSGLIPYFLRLDAIAQVQSLGEALLTLQPNHLQTQHLMLRLGLQTGDRQRVRASVAAIRRIEGEDGPLSLYARAAEIARFANDGDHEQLKLARTLAEKARQVRPRWVPLALVEASIALRQGRLTEATQHYQRALECGERDPQVIRQVVGLLQQLHRYDEAHALLVGLREECSLPAELDRLTVETALLCRAPAESVLALAAQMVPPHSTNPHDHVWLGQVYAATGRLAEADRAFCRALALAPRDPLAHLQRTLFLVRSGQPAAALAQLRQADQSLPAEQVHLVQAHGYEALGQIEVAEKAFRAMVVANPTRHEPLQALAEFYLRHAQPHQAEPLLRTLAASEQAELACWGRRQLALVCVQTLTPARLQEAIRLIHRNLLVQPDHPEDHRVKAAILAAQPQTREQAIHLLQQTIAQAPVGAQERFLLARLYESSGDWPKAREQFLELLTAEPMVSPDHLAHYIGALIERGQTDEAARWLERLERTQPQAWPTVALKARLLLQQRQPELAKQLLIEFDRATNDERIGRQVAGLLDQMGQATASETILRRWYERGHTVQRLIALAIQIGKRGGVAEALDLCDRLDNPAAAEAAVRAVLSVLSHPEATSQHLDRGQRWLEGWLHQHPQSLPLLVGLADLQSLRGRYDQSQQLYHRVLLRDPHNLAALNHWATELALRGRHSEALPLIHRAIASHGELPALLETRGLIHLEAGRLEAAVSDLERAIAEQPSAVRYFHLARVQFARRERAATRQALERASQLGLSQHDLHPLERIHFERLWPLRDQS